MTESSSLTAAGLEHDLIPLAILRAGQCGRIGQVMGNSALLQRLRELGLRHGAAVRMVRPGCPCIIRLDGQKLCVRAEELSSVMVCPEAAAS